MLKWFAIPCSSGSHFVRTLYYDPSILGGSARHGFVTQGCDPCDDLG